MIDEVESTKLSHVVKAALERYGAAYQTGFHGPDQDGRYVHDLNFVLNGEHFQVTVKPIEHHVRAA